MIVTGARDYSDFDKVWSTLDELLAEHKLLIVVHGQCPSGADQFADTWATTRQADGANVLVDRFPANWGSHGRAAGMRRNAEMAATGAHLCLAFLTPASRGARHMVKLARRAGIETRIYNEED